MSGAAQFLRLLQQATAGDVFNPWSQRDPITDLYQDAAAARRSRLLAHLDCDAGFVLIGEAAGYQGAKVSGLAFTSERLLLEGAIPRARLDGRLTSRPRPWSEPSATTVWGTLHRLGIADRTVLWNAYPWHPHKPGQRHSNRTPTRTERQTGVPVLQALLALFPRAQVLAVGRNAEASLAELGMPAPALRHPSMGGAALFAAHLRQVVMKERARQGSAC